MECCSKLCSGKREQGAPQLEKSIGEEQRCVALKKNLP